MTQLPLTLVGRFQIQSYTVGQAQLHLRSWVGPFTGLIQSDVLFVGVEEVHLPTTFTDMVLRVESGPRSLNTYRIAFEGGEGMVVAARVIAEPVVGWDGPPPWERPKVELVAIPDNPILRCLARVRVRPGMYIGDERARTLERFLVGYECCLSDVFRPGDGPDVLTEFREWLSQEMNETRSLGWYGLIELEDASDRNVYTFFKRFDEFLWTRGESLDAWKQT